MNIHTNEVNVNILVTIGYYYTTCNHLLLLKLGIANFL